MSSIERLDITGIRSFGPDIVNVINFSAPLTLILGQNGCGKTTIIEALKYAICGDLPAGTDSGSGFVHDPKLANTHEVKGNVKLRCRSVKGRTVDVSRVVRVQQKAKKLEFKSLDATFTRYIGNGMQSTSGKCADIDATMCEALGTSEAVLTNVILCHQEDSLWPLEKGKKIKERFDAIFGITEYNKCVDYFHSTTKELTQKKTTLKKDVEYTRKHWEETKEKRRQLEDFRGKEAACQDEIRKIETEMEPINEQIREMIFKEENYTQHKVEMTGKENRQKLIVETIDELKKEIRDEFFGDKSDLLNEIRNFEEKLKETQVKLTDLTEERAKLLSEEARIQKDINGKSMLMGQLQRDEDENRKNIDARNKCLRNLGTELEINVVSSSQLTATSSEDALRDIENKIKTRHTQMKEFREEQSQFESQIQSKIDTLRERKSTLNHELKTKQKTIENNEREMKKVKAEIAEVDKSGDKLASLEKNLKEVNEQLATVIDSLDANACKADIEKANEDLKMLDGKVASVENEIKHLHKVNLERTNLNKLIERRKTLEDELNVLEKKHHETLQHLLTSIPKNDIKPQLESRVKELKEEISAHDNAVKELERKLCVLGEKKRNVEDQIKQKKKKISQDEDKISEHLRGAEDIETYHKSIIDKLNKENDTKGTFNASQHMYKKYVIKLRSEENACPLCYREFENRDESEELITDLEKKIKLIPQQLEPVEQQIKTLQNQQTIVASLLPLDEEIKRIRNVELPKLKSDLEAKEREIKSVDDELKSRKEKLLGPQMDLEMASKVLPDVALMDARRKEIQTVKRDIESQQAKLPTNASERTLEQANEEQDKLRQDIKNLREKLKNDQETLSSYNDRVNKLRERKTDLTAQQLKIVGGVQKRKNLTEKLEELDLMQATLMKELELAQAQLEPINEELDQTNRTLVEMKTKHQLRLEDRRREVTDFEMKVNEIKNLQSKIARYTKDGAGRRLEETKRELEEKRERKDKLEFSKNKIEKELEEHKKFQNTHELQKRDLDLNLKLRHKNEELIAVKEEIKVLEGRVKVLNYDQLLRERRQTEKKKTELEATKHHHEGKLANIRSNVRDKMIELNKPENKNAEDDYRKYMVKLAVTSKSIEDLKLYEKAMAWAMLIFHQEKMKMINEIIRDLWRHIYKGNDIDYIEVKTDESTSGSETKRTYNYKVVQVKNGIEIDMPGRCSAGQKVLACLIIRLALAETFCKHCGILALDEPTTNLDRENIDSLSEALVELVERRNTNRNFQLLVITHDEDFLSKLFRVDGVETYLNVKRDSRGRSQVVRREVM